ncbi:MAG: phosphomethylpyrimidine synthase, partial [Pseudomonadota bacterium]
MNKPIAPGEMTPPAVSTGPLPASRKVYTRPAAAPDVAAPHREIALSDPELEPVRVYDTSGPYTDDAVEIDVAQGLARLRAAWVEERGGVVSYVGRDVKPEDNGFATGARLAPAFPARHAPLKGDGSRPLTQLQAARAGIVTKEMIYVAERENVGRAEQLARAEGAIADGESFGAELPAFVTPE